MHTTRSIHVCCRQEIICTDFVHLISFQNRYEIGASDAHTHIHGRPHAHTLCNRTNERSDEHWTRSNKKSDAMRKEACNTQACRAKAAVEVLLDVCHKNIDNFILVSVWYSSQSFSPSLFLSLSSSICVVFPLPFHVCYDYCNLKKKKKNK